MGRKWTHAQRAKFKRTLLQKKVATSSGEISVNVSTTTQSDYVHFAHGYVRGWLDSFASRIGVSGSALAGRVGALLHASTGRPKRRAVD